MLGVEGKLITEISEEEINRIWLKHYDKGVRPNLEYPEIPLYDFLDNSAEKFPDKVALDFIGKEITYRQLKEASERIAGYLKSIGVKKGDKIILDLPNTPHYVIAYFGVLKAGGTVVQCNPLYTEREVRHIAENSEAKIAFCIENAYPKLRKLKEEGVLEKIVVCRVEDYLKFPLNILYKFKKKRSS